MHDVPAIAQELWRSGECYPFCHMIGITEFECLWGEFFRGFSRDDNLARIVLLVSLGSCLKALLVQHSKVKEVVAIARRFTEEFSLLRGQRQRLFLEARVVLEQLSQHYQLGLLTNGAPD